MDPIPAQIIEQKPVQPQTQSSFPWLKVLLIVAGVVLALGLIGGAYYVGTKQQSSVSVDSETMHALPTRFPTPTPDPTANWQVFASTQNTFSLKAPKTFTKDPRGTGDIIFLEQQTDPTTHQPITPLSVLSAEYISNNGSTNEMCATNDDCYQELLAIAKGASSASSGRIQYQEVTTTILGQVVKGTEIYTPELNTSDGTHSPSQVNYYFDISHNGKRFRFEFDVQGDLTQGNAAKITIDTILSTFTFVYSTAGWQTYAGNGITFKYPNTWEVPPEYSVNPHYVWFVDPTTGTHTGNGGSILYKDSITVSFTNSFETTKAYIDAIQSEQIPALVSQFQRKVVSINGRQVDVFHVGGRGK